MTKWISAAIATLLLVSYARADLRLFAKYDWADGAKDVSGSPIHHDGVLDPEASIAAGKLLVHGWDGVSFGSVPELDNATQVFFRFENVTFTDPRHYSVLAGDAMQWWVAVYHPLVFGESRSTELVFNLGGYGRGSSLQVQVADTIVDHFDSIEYRLDATAPLDQRFAIRWNDGPWTVGGTGDPLPDRIPPTTDFRFNNGGPADWDPMWGSIGPVSIYSNIAVPEPTWGAFAAACLLLLTRRRTA